MLPLKFAKERTSAVLREIQRLKQIDFPYGHSHAGLAEIELIFQDRLNSLNEITADNHPSVVRAACLESLKAIANNLPYLGFILRSTDFRNSFETFGPLLRLARKILGKHIKLVVSSEWTYSPHILRATQSLPNFVLMGLPASESANPLLIPLAGHELGHTAWQLRGLEDVFSSNVFSKILEFASAEEKKYKEIFGSQVSDTLLANTNLSPAHKWAMRQCEESFCDFLGLKIFGESYLWAFAYLVSPGAIPRTPWYPDIHDRAKNLEISSAEFGVSSPAGFESWFSKCIYPKYSEKEAFWLFLADQAREAITPDIIRKVNEIAVESSLPLRDDNKIEKVLTAFQLMIPASGVGDLVNILNAAWKAYNEESLWAELPIDRVSTLNELILKSIEILEYEERLAANDT
ncbi:hypothetical protein [Bremerella sp.]|uniref:hypothetical protein n=1 Tax=Bremerella sp. TaxID=2795602 RepID=UPI0039189336